MTSYVLLACTAEEQADKAACVPGYLRGQTAPVPARGSQLDALFVGARHQRDPSRRDGAGQDHTGYLLHLQSLERGMPCQAPI